jgi:hypothetical protein
LVDYNNADTFDGPITPYVPTTQSITISRQSVNTERQFTLPYNKSVNNHTTSPITDSEIHHYVYGNPYYNVNGNIEVLSGDILTQMTLNAQIDNNETALTLQYSPPIDTNIVKETFYYTVFYQTPTQTIIQSNNCHVTINITD